MAHYMEPAHYFGVKIFLMLMYIWVALIVQYVVRVVNSTEKGMSPFNYPILIYYPSN